MRVFLLIVLVTLTGCRLTVERAAEVEPYSRSEIDAINANTECKRLARTMVEIARCDTERR